MLACPAVFKMPMARLRTPVLEPLPDGSWRSVLASPRIDPRWAAGRELLAAAGRGEDLPGDQAR
jgi:hypothetical protein